MSYIVLKSSAAGTVAVTKYILRSSNNRKKNLNRDITSLIDSLLAYASALAAPLIILSLNSRFTRLKYSLFGALGPFHCCSKAAGACLYDLAPNSSQYFSSSKCC